MAERVIPYGRQNISEDDIQAVVEVLRSDWLTQGPVVARFEQAVADYCGARYAVAVANGTAGLHLAALVAGFGPGDEVITSPLTFVASANCIAYAGARPVFADIDPASYCIDTAEIRHRLTPRTRGLIPVHFSGCPCDMGTIAEIAAENGLLVIEDAAHALGATYTVGSDSFRVGSCAHSDMTIFSFHPVKHITTGEGGLVTTNSHDIYTRLVMFRSHGITRDPELLLHNDGPWYYEQQVLGFNYRITDFQCALGLSQLQRLDAFVDRRRRIAGLYDKAFSAHDRLILPAHPTMNGSSWHLYVVGIRFGERKAVFEALRARGVEVNVHYIPVHLQPYYREHFGYASGDLPNAENHYQRSLTLPLFPSMTDDDVRYVIDSVLAVIEETAP